MRSTEDKVSYNYASPQEGNNNTNLANFEFPKGNGGNKGSNQRKALGSRTKPTPSKWDDAQKWLVGLSGGGHGQAHSMSRNSDADDLKLLRVMSQKGRNSCSSVDGGFEGGVPLAITVQDQGTSQDEGETKKIDCSDRSMWMGNTPIEDSMLEVQSVYVRDVGTEMTPIASQEPSRTATPLRATTPMLTSPIASTPTSPGRCHQGPQHLENHQMGTRNPEGRNEAVGFGRMNGNEWSNKREEDVDGCKILRQNGPEQVKTLTSLESRAVAWDEAERAKYMARYRREEVKIQAWENHENRKAEMEMKRVEVKADRMKSRAEEKLSNKLASTRRIAEEKRSNAEAKLNEHAARTTEKAEYIRRTGHLPSSFLSFKIPSFCS